jgi:hypothetical protein
MRVLTHACRGRPKSAAVYRCCVRPNDAANMLITIEDVVIVVASRSRLVGLFKNQHANALILHGNAIARDRPPKRLVADLSLEKQVLKDIASRNL